MNIASTSAAALPSQPQALFSSQPETFSLIQNHLQDAVRSIGDAVPWTAHQHVATNNEGTKRAHILAPNDSAISIQKETGTVQQNFGLPASNIPVAQKPLHRPMPLQMPQPLASQFPPVQSNLAAALQAKSALNSDNSAASPLSRPAAPSVVPTNMNGATAPAFHPGFTPSMPGLQPNGAPATEMPVSFLQNVAPPPLTVSGSVPVCGEVRQSKAGASKEDTKVSRSFFRNASSDSFPISNYICVFKTQPCRIQGCGEVAVSRRPYCVKHSGNRLCEHAGCTKCAQGSTRFCIAHGGGRRCTYPGCDKGARDKFFCAA